VPITSVPIAIGGTFNPSDILLEFDITENGPFYSEKEHEKSKRISCNSTNFNDSNSITSKELNKKTKKKSSKKTGTLGDDNIHIKKELKCDDIEYVNFDKTRTHDYDTNYKSGSTKLSKIKKRSLRAKNREDGLPKGITKLDTPQDLKSMSPQKKVRGNTSNTTKVSHILKIDDYHRRGEKFLEGRLRRIKEEITENPMQIKKEKKKRNSWVVVVSEPIKTEKTCKINCSIQ
jgi:hypothetical protein